LRANSWFKTLVSLAILSVSFSSVCADPPVDVHKLAPGKVGDFRLTGSVRPLRSLLTDGSLSPEAIKSREAEGLASGEVTYTAANGDSFLVELVQFRKDSEAYSFLNNIVSVMRSTSPEGATLDQTIGTVATKTARQIAFYKGQVFVRVSPLRAGKDAGNLVELARALAGQFDKGEGEIPVLVKHLPDWERQQDRVIYLPGATTLAAISPQQTVLNVVDPAGDADAVVANYDAGKLLLIEFNTPQLAGDNDRRILSKIQELSSQNQPVPAAYQRVGNYCAFVFDGPSTQAAQDLIKQVKYEQVVQWLGDNPYWLKEAERRYAETTLGVFIAVVKASGLTFLTCFGIGGLFGALLFSRRRARQSAMAAYSDAGGMLRLNLDEMTPQTDPARLISGRN